MGFMIRILPLRIILHKVQGILTIFRVQKIQTQISQWEFQFLGISHVVFADMTMVNKNLTQMFFLFFLKSTLQIHQEFKVYHDFWNKSLHSCDTFGFQICKFPGLLVSID